MKDIIGFVLAAVLFSILPGCTREAPLEPRSTSDHVTDGACAEIDTTLHIQTTQEGSLTIYKIDRFNTVVAKIPHISSYLFLQNPTKSLKQIAQDSNYALVVNASYFDVLVNYGASDTTVTYKHAGFLKIGETIYENIKDDRQITRLFAYDRRRNLVQYFSINDLNLTQAYDVVVQIGPQFIGKNEIDTASIRASFNGDLPWPRTAFASVNGKEFYVIVNLGFTPVTLLDLGVMLRSAGIFHKDLDAINFDGGFSTSLYIKGHPEFSTFPDNKMPLLLCVK